MTRAKPATVPGAANQAGFASLAFPLVLWVAVVAGVVVIDVGAYVVAAARAQAAADAAALAAAAAGAPVMSHAPQRQAERAAAANGADLERCSCSAGVRSVQVEVSVAVEGLFVPRLGATRVTAQAQAQLRRPVLLSPVPGNGAVRR